MFAVQTLLGALAVKSRLSRLGATVAPGVETVVVFHFPGRRARTPSLCMMADHTLAADVEASAS